MPTRRKFPRVTSEADLVRRVYNGVVHSAAVNLNLKAGYHRPVLSELCLVNRAGPHRRRRQTGDLVCVKVLQRYSRSHATLSSLKQVFYREAEKWKRLSHQNIVPVLGVFDVVFQTRINLSVIIPWMKNGNILEYVRRHPRVDRLRLLAEAAYGLEYLHSTGTLHGSINPRNILIDEIGQACLGDFGINHITTDPSIGLERIISFKSDTQRYMPPELLNLSEYDPKNCSPSEASDIYSLAMAAFEVLTGIIPYGDLHEDALSTSIITGERPRRPTDTAQALSDPVWMMLEDCWSESRGLRWDARCMRRRFCDPQDIRTEGIPCIGEVNLAVQLDQLQADNCPKYLAKCLQSSLEQRHFYDEYVLKLENQVEKAQALLEVFDKVLRSCPFDPVIFKRFRQLCSCARLLPLSYIIPGSLVTMGDIPVSSGAFGDVWRGVYGEQPVAIKGLRVYKATDVRKIRRAFCKEVALWKRLSHPNVVPFIGVCDAPAPLTMVSEWMPNGNIRQYVEDHPQVDRLQLLLDICRGLQFLHSHDVIHGDLKGDNILVDVAGKACLGDFGLSSIASFNCTETSAPGSRGTIRWMAPELIRSYAAVDEKPPSYSTKESDVYAFAMVAIEVFTGLIPFQQYRRNFAVINGIMLGERPLRPPEATKLGLTDDLWELIQSAWAEDATKRPSVPTIIDFFQEMPRRDSEPQ